MDSTWLDAKALAHRPLDFEDIEFFFSFSENTGSPSDVLFIDIF
jgi:hypothetical protein